MKILFVTHRYPPRTGGVETHVREIATRLADRGHEVTVFSADAGDDVPSKSSDEAVEIRRFRSICPGGSFYVAPQLALAVRRQDVDIVHAHNYHAFPLFFAALGVSDERFIVTTHYHGGSSSPIRDQLLSLYRPFGRWAVRRADEIVAVSGWEKSQLKSDLKVEATVIPNGTEVEQFSEAEPFAWERPYLLTVGRLEQYKGIQHVIRAMVDLPEYDLLVAGSGPYREELEQIAREEGVETRVKFLGYVNNEVLPELYAGAKVYVTMSEFEAYGMTVAEALAAGIPCVVREVGALVDWTKFPDVFGIDDSSQEVVQSRISVALDHEQTSMSLPTWEMVADNIEGLYSE